MLIFSTESSIDVEEERMKRVSSGRETHLCLRPRRAPVILLGTPVSYEQPRRHLLPPRLGAEARGTPLDKSSLPLADRHSVIYGAGL